MPETNEQATIQNPPGAAERVLDLAIEVFDAHGYHSASALEIVKRSGMDQEAFSRHFHSKRDIFLALIEKYYTEFARLLEENHQRFTRAFQKGKDPLAAWRENTVRIFRYHADNPGLTRIILRDARAMDEDYSWRVKELTCLIELQMMDALHLMESNGLIRHSDLEMIATIMLGSANAVIMSYLANGSQRKPEELADELMGYFLRALAPDGMDVNDAIRRMAPSRARKKRKTGKVPVLETVDEVGVDAYFEKTIRQIYRRQVRSIDLAPLQDTEITMLFTIRGKQEYVYGLRIINGSTMEIIRGGVDAPTVSFEFSEEIYRQALKGKVAEAMQTFINLSQITDRRRYDAIRDLRGCLSLELLLEDGTVLPFTIIFNEARLPSTVFRLSLDDYIAMGRGELYGMSAFVSGRLDVEGDKPFAMQLSNLLR